MNGRKLEPLRSLQAYYVYLLRLADITRMIAAWWVVRSRQEPVTLREGETRVDVESGEIANTLLLAILGWAASLIDKSKSGINVFDVWLALHPGKGKEIRELRKSMESDIELLRRFRNHVAFHGHFNLEKQQEIRVEVQSRLPGLLHSVQRLIGFSLSLGDPFNSGLLSGMHQSVKDTHQRILAGLMKGISTTANTALMQ